MPAEHLAATTARLKAEAVRLGFDMVGVAPAVIPPGYPRYLDWLSRGYEAGMGYLSKDPKTREHPGSILPGVRSVVMAGIVYGERSPGSDFDRNGKVARYARGADYHDLFWRRLEQLLEWVRAEFTGVKGRAVADTAPLLERDFARLAGLGWFGKNTMLIQKRLGSFTLLGGLLLDAELAYDAPFEADHCGTCTRCLDACPTGAFPEPGVLDANRCISYWTIEHRGPIPDPMAESLHGWAFGCDICQDVCPWNRKAPPGREPEFRARAEWSDPDLIAWLELDETAFRAMLKGTSIRRTKRTGLIRNAALILGTRRVIAAVPALLRLRDDPDDTIRWAANWALARFENETGPAEADAPSGPAE